MEKLLSLLNNRLDKVAHFSGGYILATIFPITEIYGLLLAIIAGKAKEMYDSKHHDKHTVDKLDMYATWAGGLLGCLVLILRRSLNV